MSLLDTDSRLARVQLATLASLAITELLLFLGTITPAWQVAEDTDVGRSIQSGLWIYCPGQSQCWYIFSDDLINYYERVDVCRFLLIGDCRKKLLRTPYFFGWHYAVLIIMLIVQALVAGSTVALGIGMVRARLVRTTTVLMDALLGFAFLLGWIGLAVFLINAEMLESRYLIGIKNTFEKHYGYSFVLACLGMTIMLFALMIAIFLTSTVFFMRDADAGPAASTPSEGGKMSAMGDFMFGGTADVQRQLPAAQQLHSPSPVGGYQRMVPFSQQASPVPMKLTDFGTRDGNGNSHVPRYCYAPSEVTSIP